MDPDAIERGTGSREFLVMRQRGREGPTRLGLDRINQIGHRDWTPPARDKGPSDLRSLCVAFPDPDVQGDLDSLVQPFRDELADVFDCRVVEERTLILLCGVGELCS